MLIKQILPLLSLATLTLSKKAELTDQQKLLLQVCKTGSDSKSNTIENFLPDVVDGDGIVKALTKPISFWHNREKKKKIINSDLENGKTALMIAIANPERQMEALALMNNKYVEIGKVDNSGSNALHYACMVEGNEESITAFLEVSKKRNVSPPNLLAENKENRSPLEICCENYGNNAELMQNFSPFVGKDVKCPSKGADASSEKVNNGVISALAESADDSNHLSTSDSSATFADSTHSEAGDAKEGQANDEPQSVHQSTLVTPESSLESSFDQSNDDESSDDESKDDESNVDESKDGESNDKKPKDEKPKNDPQHSTSTATASESATKPKTSTTAETTTPSNASQSSSLSVAAIAVSCILYFL